MANSLRASQQGLKIVEQARNKKGWTKRAAAWRDSAKVGEAALKKFWGRKPIWQEHFVDICKAVGIEDWNQIVDDSPIQPTASYIDFFVYDDNWVGEYREQLIKELSNKVYDSCHVLILVGITGIGKTALAERLIWELRGDWIEDRENFENRQKASDFASVVAEWLRKWGEPVPKDCQPQQLLKLLVRHLCNHRHLILMDSVEYLLTGNVEDGWGDFDDSWWGKFFDSLLEETSCQSRFILTSQDLPTKFETGKCAYYKKNRWDCQLLTGLEPNEQIALFQKAELDGDLESPSSPLRLIGEVYDGHPLALRTIAGEIKESYARNVRAYWKENSRYIEEVKNAIDAARQQGMVKGDEDRWKLSSYTKLLRQKVNERIETTFKRLKNDVYDAYFLLCTGSVYRCEVKERWWLSNLEDEGYSKERQKAAMETLRDRYLVEDGGFDHEDDRLVGQHNLIRTVAIDHRLKLPEN